ncbi:MAG: hypothetical protein EHM65_00690 [Acidobacteriales bacterium]|nr:MAG: hypothetical protein EHM65_00690 [Terriglobales bacterium]
MPELVIFHWDLTKGFEYQPKRLPKLPALPARVALDAPDALLRDLQSDPLLHQRLVDGVKQVLMESVGRLQSRVRQADIAVKPPPKFEQILLSLAKAELQFAEPRVNQMMSKLFESLAQERKDYAAYKKTVVVKVGLGGLGLGAAVLGVATAPVTGGASTVLAFVGLWRNIVESVKLLFNLAKEAETVGKQVHGNMEVLRRRYTDKTRAAVAKREVAASVINAILQTEVTNLSRANSDCELWRNKLCHLRDQAHDLAVKLNKALNETERLDRLYWRKEFAGPRAQVPTTKSEKAYAKIKQRISTLLDTIPTTHQRAEYGLQAHGAAKTALTELQRKSPAFTAAFDKYFAVAANLGLASASNFYGIQNALDAKSIQDWTFEGVALASDLASTADGLS